MNKFLAKNYLIIAGVVIVAIVGGIYWYIKTNEAPSFVELAVGRGNVIDSVDQSGNIIAENNVNLSFQASGQIAAVTVKEGEYVPLGATLAVLDESSLKAAVEQANAVQAAAQAKLDGLSVGTRPEQLQIDKSAVANAQLSLEASLES